MATVNEAKKTLQEGGILLYPTDTVWGLGCDATDENAVQRIAELKGRSGSKSFIVLVNSFHMLEKFVPEFPEICYDLIDLSEKPLTIIYDNPKGLAKNVLAEDGSIGIRLTDHPVVNQLIQSIRKPIVSTSANISGESTPTRFSEISEKIKSGVDAIVEEEIDKVCKQASSIIKIGADSSVKVIR